MIDFSKLSDSELARAYQNDPADFLPVEDEDPQIVMFLIRHEICKRFCKMNDPVNIDPDWAHEPSPDYPDWPW